MAGRVMIMAGGTGGHVFPALAVAQELRQRDWQVFWVGTRNSFEARVIPAAGIAMEWIDISGVRGKGLLRKLLLPFRLLNAMLQAGGIIRRNRPDLVLGMGGFVSGPGGLMARLMGKPLVIQEQNTIPGMTNRWLAKLANRVFEAFPGSFPASAGAVQSGNPVRAEIIAIEEPQQRLSQPQDMFRVLVLGGSLGALALNETMPEAMRQVISAGCELEIRHQTGRDKVEATDAAYKQAGVEARVEAFIDDMATAYAWADLVICRSGALTVSELTATGVAAVLVPYPYAVDDHQTGNGQFLVDAGAALMIQQRDLSADALAEELLKLFKQEGRLLSMAMAARRLAVPESSRIIADACEELLS